MTDELLTQTKAEVFKTTYLPADRLQLNVFYNNVCFRSSIEEQHEAGLHLWKGYDIVPSGKEKDAIFYHCSGAWVVLEDRLKGSLIGSKINIIGSDEAIRETVLSLELLSERRLEEELRDSL